LNNNQQPPQNNEQNITPTDEEIINMINSTQDLEELTTGNNYNNTTGHPQLTNNHPNCKVLFCSSPLIMSDTSYISYPFSNSLILCSVSVLP